MERLFVGALALRLALVGYGMWQDAYLDVKYTDVDYNVYTDAAIAVWHGGSPFERLTYRYPPLLAVMLTPNVWLSSYFGKLLFIFFDIAVGWVIAQILLLRNYEHAKFWTALWLLHPFSINISTRGNADSLTCLLIVLTVFCLMEKRVVWAGIYYGLAVHFRIFPIIFAPCFVFFLNGDYKREDKKKVWYLQCFRERFTFAATSGGLFLLSVAIGYLFYGWPFLYEAYLYHLGRTDNRHNFSVYFYSLYLQYGETAGLLTGLLAFVPQLLCQVSLCIAFHRDILFCICMQTMAFVAFNKVCTAQYFLWYTALLPLALPRHKLPPTRGVALFGIWFIAELIWLHFAYQLEFLGLNTFTQLWVAGVAFFVANILVMASIIQGHQFTPLFKDGKITSYH